MPIVTMISPVSRANPSEFPILPLDLHNKRVDHHITLPIRIAHEIITHNRCISFQHRSSTPSDLTSASSKLAYAHVTDL